MKYYSVGQTDRDPSVYAMYRYVAPAEKILAKSPAAARKIFCASHEIVGYVKAEFICNA